MSRTRNDIENPRRDISRLAMASIVLGALGLAVFAWRLLAYRPWWSEYLARNIVGLLGIVGLVLGHVALARISRRIATITLLVVLSPPVLFLCSFLLLLLVRNSAGYHFLQRCGFYLAIALLVLMFPVLATREWRSRLGCKSRSGTLATLGIVMGTLLAGSWWMETCGPVSTAMRMACAINLKRLGDAMETYANDKPGNYTDPNQWCDLLLQHTHIDADLFLCPQVKWEWRRQVLPFPIPKNEKCYYAMNPDCEPNSPKDTVLLFEIDGGWNKSGGLKLMTAENHRGYGSVLFNDGRVECVHRRQFRKLKWSAGADNSTSTEHETNSTK
ncbi:MAG: hypothetical protein CEE38_02220 [Planctomycetes bacterium B3_Pla]|nr:MAG: hypothetical protein CEE38_02220 [Planctomycetes bacterium B3_Pla]